MATKALICPPEQTAAWFSRVLALDGSGRALPRPGRREGKALSSWGLLCWAGPPGRLCSETTVLPSQLVSRCPRSTDALPANSWDFHEQPGVGVMRGCEHFPRKGSARTGRCVAVELGRRAPPWHGLGLPLSEPAPGGTLSQQVPGRGHAVPSGEGSTEAGGVPSPRENRGLGTREIWGFLRRGAAFNSPKAWEVKAASGRG